LPDSGDVSREAAAIGKELLIDNSLDAASKLERGIAQVMIDPASKDLLCSSERVSLFSDWIQVTPDYYSGQKRLGPSDVTTPCEGDCSSSLPTSS